jgi:hypothetical protein
VLFNSAFEYVIRKAQERQVELKLNGTHELLVYADDVNLVGSNRNSGRRVTKKNDSGRN